MTTVYVSVDDEGNIIRATTTVPDKITYAENDEIPDFQYQFELTWEQIEDLWRYRVVGGELTQR